jgi:hypothetical protein
MMNSEKMLYGCPFEKITFLPRIDANSGFGREWKIFDGRTFIALLTKVFGHKYFQISYPLSKFTN